MKRRAFLGQTGAAFGGSWITMTLPAILATASAASAARADDQAFRVLSPSEATEFEAIAAQIIPSGDTPGATEAGVIWFIDRALADLEPTALEPLREGLLGLQVDIRETYAAESFASLDNARQIEVLRGIDDTPFFDTLRFLTIAGMFCNPSQGGNRDGVGWKLIGFEGPLPTQPPFGYYDADYAKRGA
jgi:gluconate 2-dehydrogenase gamma chain